MKKEKRTPTRRRTALKRVGAVALMLVLIWVLERGSILPLGTVGAMADREGTGPVEVVKDLGPLPLGGRPRWVYLAANEDAALLGTAGFHLSMLGWWNGVGAALDCSGEGPVHMAWWSVSNSVREKEREGYVYCFGRVDDPAAQEVGMMYAHRDEAGELTVYGFQGSQLTSRREEWVRYNGRDYFVISAPLDAETQRETHGDYYLCVDGAMVEPDTKVGQWTSTSLGD